DRFHGLRRDAYSLSGPGAARGRSQKPHTAVLRSPRRGWQNCHGRNRSLSSGVKAQTNRVLPHHDGGHHGTGRHGPDNHGAGGDDVVGQGRPWNPRMMSRVPTPQAPTGDSWAPSRLFGPRPPSSPKSL